MELWSMAAKGFPAILQKTAIQRPSYELLYKGNVSSNDNDEHLQVTRTLVKNTFITFLTNIQITVNPFHQFLTAFFSVLVYTSFESRIGR